MSDPEGTLIPTVVAAHREGSILFIRWNIGFTESKLLDCGNTLLSLSEPFNINHDPDPEGHVWKAITGQQAHGHDDDVLIEKLGVSVLLANVLDRNGVKTVGDLRKTTESQRRSWRNYGNICEGQVRRILKGPKP